MTGSIRSKRCDSLRALLRSRSRRGSRSRFWVARPRNQPRRRAPRRCRAAGGGTTGGARPTRGANATAPIRAIQTRLSIMRGHCENGQRPQAVAVLEQAAIQNPKHRGVLDAFGRALADDGHYTQAVDVLDRAQAPRATGLAHPLGPRRGARSDGTSRRGATILRHRAEDRAGRAVGLVQSRSLLRALQGPRAGGERRCGGRPYSRMSIRGCARTSLSSSVCRDGSEADGHRALGSASRRRHPSRRSSAAGAGAAERLERQSEIAVKPVVRAEGS